MYPSSVLACVTAVEEHCLLNLAGVPDYGYHSDIASVKNRCLGECDRNNSRYLSEDLEYLGAVKETTFPMREREMKSNSKLNE